MRRGIRFGPAISFQVSGLTSHAGRVFNKLAATVARIRRFLAGERIVNQGPLLLYDGACALCNGAVLFVLNRDARRDVRVAPLQGDTARAFLAEHPELTGVDSMIWIDAHGRPFTRSAAAMAIGRHLGGVWSTLASLATIAPTVLRDGAYDLVARVRYRAFGRYDACPIPPPEHRERFLP